MDEQRAAEVLRNLDLRTKRMEQILPDLPTRDEMKAAIREAVEPLATKEELQAAVAKLATKEELQATVAKLATKEELEAVRLAAKRDLDEAVARLATKDELRAGLEETKAELRQEMHEMRDALVTRMDVWAERIASHVQLVAEANLALDARDARQDRDVWEELRRLAKTDARQHVDVMKDLEKLHARLLKAEGKPPRKRRA